MSACIIAAKGLLVRAENLVVLSNRNGAGQVYGGVGKWAGLAFTNRVYSLLFSL